MHRHFLFFPGPWHWRAARRGGERGGEGACGSGVGGYNRQVTVKNSCGERLRLSLGVGQTSRQEHGG